MAQRVRVLESASRTTDQTSAVIQNYEKANALHLVVDVTVGSPNLVVTIKGSDQVSGKAYTLLASSILNTTGTTVMKLGPDYTAAANVAKDYLPYEWLVTVTQSGAVPATYSIGASMI